GRGVGGRELVMPRAAITDDEGAKALEAAGTDIKYLLSRHEVSLDNQKLFFHHGVTTLEMLSNFAKDRDDLALVLKDHWELDASRSLEERVQVAAITCAFINAKTRSQRAAEVDAEYDTLQWSRPVVAGEWAAMRSALEKRYGHLEDKIYPSKEYIEKKLAEVEHGEYRAEELTEVVSKEELEPDSVVPIWDSKGRLAMRRGSTKVEEPTNAEELRRRLSIWKNAMVMISLKHSNRHELQGAWEDTVEQYKDYLLGDYVFGLSAKDAEGQTFASPPWILVIAYERAIRKQAVKITNTEGKPLTVALKMAWKDATIKERNFTTPLALYAKRPTPPWREQPQAKLAQRKGVHVVITELDIQSDRKSDFAIPSVQKKWLQLIAKGSEVQKKRKPEDDPGPAEKRHNVQQEKVEEWVKLRLQLRQEAVRKLGSLSEVEKEAFKMAKGGNAFSLVRDEEFLEQAKVGLPLGILNQLPRTPEIFEEQLRWNLESENWSSAVWQKENYVSAAEHEKYLTEHLEQEVAEGLMTKMGEETFVATYGEDRAVAALAVLVEDEVTGKKRVIHDGTHGVMVNHKIRCRDKVRMPGPREKRTLLEEYEAEQKTVLSLVGDFAKAHRRFKYAVEEQGFLACKASSGSNIVYVNKVGTFGIASTPYWWARLSAALMRLVYWVLGEGFPNDMLLYADDLEVLTVGREGRVGGVLAYALIAALGAPFKWAKQRGGLTTEWIGLTTYYRSFAMGLSVKRTEWVLGWIRSLRLRKEVTYREFAAGLGSCTSVGEAIVRPAVRLGISNAVKPGCIDNPLGNTVHSELDCKEAQRRWPHGSSQAPSVPGWQHAEDLDRCQGDGTCCLDWRLA
ncbi:unnamed protein product, partial [Durusdinium trenchii]